MEADAGAARQPSTRNGRPSVRGSEFLRLRNKKVEEPRTAARRGQQEMPASQSYGN
jgi:hypothetical protein